MNIALLGYGKMGAIIEKVALERGHKIVLKVGSQGFDDTELLKADVAIEFSVPSAAYDHIHQSISAGIPIVSGTTGWLDRLPEIEGLCKKKNGSFIYASNFSLGVNLFFALNERLAELMDDYDYRPALKEIHHTKKLDAPSGTAITLAEGIIENLTTINDWKLLKEGESLNDSELGVSAERVDPTPGTHIVSYSSEIDTIEIKHTAHNRNGFALGAVIAAEYLIKNPGIRTMKDVLGL